MLKIRLSQLVGIVLGSALTMQAMACSLMLTTENFKTDVYKNAVLTIVSTDNKYQQSIDLGPNQRYVFSSMPCDTDYKIYAQMVNPINTTNNVLSTGPAQPTPKRTEPFGDYSYIANPLHLTGDFPIYFPSKFKRSSDSLSNQ